MEDALAGVAAGWTAGLRLGGDGDRVQREVGGNLAQLLTTVADPAGAGSAAATGAQPSAEGRLSAWILGLLPVVFAGYLMLARPDYIGVLFRSALGWVMVVLGVLALAVGVFWLAKVVRVEV